MTDNIRPDHYRTGEIDLFEEWYLTYPFEQYRAIMQSHAEKYLRRNKVNRVEDLDKCVETIRRLKEKEIEQDKQNSKTINEEIREISKTKNAGQYLDEIYFNREDLLERLLKEGYEYLARDKILTLWAYKSMPKKDGRYWAAGGGCEIIEDDNFLEVKWSDDEPTKIADLLASYENGGENGK